MKAVLASALAALALASPAAAADPLVDWGSTRVEGGTALPGAAPGGVTALRVVSRSDTGATFRLAEIDAPAIRGDQYAVMGQVRYEDVKGTGYLEMWSVFEDGRYFSRTLAPSGALGKLSGTSGWRSFELPFFLDGHAAPKRLELNVVLPGRGTVVLGPLSLEQTAAQSAWWSERTAGLFGAVLGTIMGLLGAAVGVLASRGRARRFVLSALLGFAVVGALLLGVAVAAIATGEPRHVWYSALLAGVIAFVLGISLLAPMRRRYAEVELRKMRALDLAGPVSR